MLAQERLQLKALEAAKLDIAGELRTDDLFRTLVSQSVNLTRSDAGCLYDCRPGQDLLGPIANIALPPSAMENVARSAREAARKVVESQRALILDIHDEHRSDGTTTLAAVPVLHDGHVVAILELLSSCANAFSQDDLDLLTQLTSQAAVALRNAQLHEENGLRAEQLTIVNRVAQAVSKTLDLENLTTVVHQEIEAAFELDAFFIALYNETTNELDYCRQVDDGTIAPPERKPLGKGLTASVIKGREPLLIQDFEAERDQLPSAELWGTMKTPGSWLGVPMEVGDRAVGVISVQAYRPHAYGENEQELLTRIAEHVATGLKNTQVYQETSRRLAQCEVLRELMLAAASTLDFDLVLERALEALHTTVGAECIGFAVPDSDRKSITLHPSQIGFPADAERLALEMDHSICGRVLLTGQPIVLNDVRESSCYHRGRAETRSELAVPVIVHGKAAGVLNVESSRANAFGEVDLHFYTTIASQLGMALENARLFEAERRQRQQTEALEEAAAVVSGTLNLDQVLNRILEQVARVVPGDAFDVLLIRNDDTARVVGRRGYEDEEWGVRSLSIDEYPFLQQMIRSGKPIVVPDTADEPHWVLEEGKEPWKSYVGAPVTVGGVVVGFLNVNSTRRGAFSQQDAQGLQAFAHHAAAAIENAQLYEELHTYANSLEKRVEERTSQLRSQYAQLDAILESTTDGIILADVDGNLVLANPVARRWLRQALSPEESDQLRAAVKALAARAEAKPELVLELTGLDLQITAAPVRKPTVEQARAVIAIHDVSHLKALNRMKSRFVSNVSHELRTPIATIKLLAHLMEKQPDRWKEYLDPLKREAEHQAKLVHDILEMSRVDAGRLEIHPEPTNLNELVRTAAQKYRNQTKERRLTLDCYLAETEPVVMVDSQWIMQVLANLLSNAVRYTLDGGSVKVTTGCETTDGRAWATVTVADTGIGIPENEMPYIFDRFFRGERPQTMQVSGTGLGLAILKEIMELHGGRVTVESEVDEGTSFTVWLPSDSR